MRNKKIPKIESKDIGIELMRVLGCLIVIACHCVVAHKFDGVYYFPNTYIATFAASFVLVVILHYAKVGIIALWKLLNKKKK